jgi:pimeloyl-ACP methyl ester carboxylesterase
LYCLPFYQNHMQGTCMATLPGFSGKLAPPFKIKILTALFFLAAVLLLDCGCANDCLAGNAPGGIRIISGRVSGLDAHGGTMALLDAKGGIIPASRNGVGADGAYRLVVEAADIPPSAGYVLRFTKGGKELRSLIMAWAGLTDYSGDEAQVSPFTEAAFLLCGLTTNFNYSDYAAFLGSYTNGSYNYAAPHAYDFSFRAIFPEVVAAVSNYSSTANAAKPDPSAILDLLEQQGHTLDTALPSGQEDIRFIKKALVTNDRSALLLVRYTAGESNTAGSGPVAITAVSQSDGGISWNTYTLDLGSRVLGGLNVRALEITDLAPGNLGIDGVQALSAGTLVIPEATGLVRVSISNAAQFIDIDACGLYPDATNTKAAFQVHFSETPATQGLVIQFIRMDGDGKNKQVLAEVKVTDQKTYQSPVLDLLDKSNQDHIIMAAIKSGHDTLYSMSDPIDMTRYQKAAPMIAMERMFQTRADPAGADIFNNIGSSNDTNIMPVTAGNTATHYILDLDRFLGTGVMPLWDNTAYGKSPIGDGSGRTPLIIIHGWQGGHDLRDAAKLSMWENSPVHAESNFIEYYLSKPELQKAYHLYYVRWPSYKHLQFSSGVLARLLADIRTSRPETDLAIAMSGPDKGVVIITHSTGGLIARSAIETHLAFALGDDKFAALRRVLLMASPNHGTPVAVNTYIQKILYDLATQASGDLEWDSFDGNSNIKFEGVHYDYLKDRSSRWDPKNQNLKAFDEHFIGLLGEPDIKTYNPWLVWFNRSFESLRDQLKDKYILYSGWLRPDLWPLKQHNTMMNGVKMDIAGDYLGSTGYQNDGVLTVSSNLFANSAGDIPFNPVDKDQIPKADWYPNSDMHFTQNWVTRSPTTTPAIIFGSQQDHPRGMAFRLFWDYDHINTRAGAVNAFKVFGSFDKFLDMDDVIADDVSIPSIFLTEHYRRDYIRAALNFATGHDPGFIDVRYNPLRYEPMFLCVEKDLTDAMP